MWLRIELICAEGKIALTGRRKSCSFDEIGTVTAGIYNRRRGVMLALIAGTTFLLLINSSWKATPDSALYLELGESLASGEGYVFNGEPHTYVPPGYPLMVAAAVRLFPGGFLGYRILMVIVGLLTAGVGYFLVHRLSGSDTAFLAGGLFAVNHTLVYNSTFTTSDVPFALFSLLALHAILSAERTSKPVLWTVAAGFLAGLPALIRVNGWGIPPAGALYLFSAWRSRGVIHGTPRTAVFLAVSLIPGLVWECYKASFPISFNEGTYLNAITGRSLQTQLAVIVASAWAYVQETSFALTAVSLRTGLLELLIPSLVLFGIVASLARGERLLVPLTAIQMSGLLLSPAGSRYMILLLPGLYLFLALGIVRVSRWISAKAGHDLQRWCRPRIILVSVFAALSVFNIGHNLATIVQARTPLEAQGAESSRDLPFFKAARWLKGHAGNAVVLTMYPRVIHYLSGLPTVELVRSGVPEHEVWVDAQQEIRRLIRDREPTFFFSDAKNDNLLSQVRLAAEGLGLRLEEVSEASSPPRFHVWKIHQNR